MKINFLKYSCYIAAALFIFSSCKHSKTSDCNSIVNTDTSAAGKAIVEISAQLEKDSMNAGLHYKRARLYFEKNELTESYKDILKVISVDSSKSEYFMLLADLSFQANKIKSAKAALEKARALNPDNYDAALRLAELYLYLRQNNTSLQYLDTVLQKQPGNDKAMLMKGFNLKEKGDTTNAIKIFQQAVENNPKYYEAYMQLGALMQAKNNKLAVNYFDNALKIKPNSEEALYGRGLWYQDHNDFNKAIQDYTSIVQINPKNKNAHFNLGYIHQVLLKVYDEAIKHYSHAIDADPNYAEAFYNRGLCYETVGNIMAAREDYQRATQLKPDYKVAEDGLKRVSQ